MDSIQLDLFKEHVEHYSQSTTLTTRGLLANYSLGLAGETGELIDEFKKTLFRGKSYNEKNVILESGDVLFYLIGLKQQLEKYDGSYMTDEPMNYYVSGSMEFGLARRIPQLLEMLRLLGKIENYLDLVVVYNRKCSYDVYVQLNNMLQALIQFLASLDISVEDVFRENIKKLNEREPR